MMRGAFVALTIGGILVYTGIKGLSVLEALAGEQGHTLNPRGGSVTFPGTGGGTPDSQDALPHGTQAAPAGTTNIDGVPVANWIVPHIQCARANGWKGKVTSGYRSVAQQRAACIGVCGNPNGCPGRCAKPGSSNHQGMRWPRGAVDVSDPAGFAAAVRHCNGFGRLVNNLPQDRVHFSQSGR